MAVLDDIFGLGQEGASDPLTGLAMILEDIFGPGASVQAGAPPVRQGQRMQPGQMMLPGNLKTSNVGEVGPSGIPQLMRAPQQPQQRPQQQRQAPPSLLPEPNLLDRFAAFAGAPNLGEGIKAATSGMDQQQEQARGTYAALIKRGIEPDMAKMIVSDRDMLKKVIPSIFSNAISPAAPNIINLKSKDEFGQETETPYYWNPKTRKLEPASDLTGGSATQPKMSPASLSGGQQIEAPKTGAHPVENMTAGENRTLPAPSLMPPQAQGGQQFMIPGDLQTQNIGDIGAPGPQGGPQTAETLPAQPEQLGTAPAAPQAAQGRYIFGPPAPEKRLGTGYMQKTDESGRFLWQRENGRLMPVVEPKAAAEARGKAEAATAGKKAELELKRSEEKIDDEYKLQDMLANVDSTFVRAAELLSHPGFEELKGLPMGGEIGIQGTGVTMADLVPGTSRADAFNRHKNLLARVAITTMERLKSQSAQGATGFGALSERELKVLEDSVEALRLSSGEDLVRNYQEFQKALLNTRERIIGRYKKRYGEEPDVQSTRELFDRATQGSIDMTKKPYTRPQRIPLPGNLSFEIPFSKTQEPYSDSWFD